MGLSKYCERDKERNIFFSNHIFAKPVNHPNQHKFEDFLKNTPVYSTNQRPETQLSHISLKHGKNYLLDSNIWYL